MNLGEMYESNKKRMLELIGQAAVDRDPGDETELVGATGNQDGLPDNHEGRAEVFRRDENDMCDCGHRSSERSQQSKCQPNSDPRPNDLFDDSEPEPVRRRNSQEPSSTFGLE